MATRPLPLLDSSTPGFADITADDDTFVLNVHVPTRARSPERTVRSRSTPWPPRQRHCRRSRTTIAVYCMSGNMSATAVQDLADLGYTDVVELDGGMMAWMADGRELLPPAA
ncbi:hypothetical protein GS531_24805 [Rhodococcus hoagii]|nr:hypothetical protein [Prescottella equi]